MRKNMYIPKTKRGERRKVEPKVASNYTPVRKLAGAVRRELGLVPGLVRTVEAKQAENTINSPLLND